MEKYAVPVELEVFCFLLPMKLEGMKNDMACMPTPQTKGNGCNNQ